MLRMNDELMLVEPSEEYFAELAAYRNDFLRTLGGHIGYSVRPSERKKGYASWMLKNVQPYCKSLGLSEILVCCLDTNEGSRRTILKNGGRFDGTAYHADENKTLERYWITL